MPEQDKLPEMIGRYEVKALLGSGAMGSVYLAEDPRIKRKVAIKVVKLDAIKSEADRVDFLNRFQREAEVSGLLNDPGIVTIYDVGDSELGPFLAMEFVKGKPLDAYVKAPDMLGLTLADKMRIAIAIGVALDHAHSHGVVHRDVKPANVMIGEDGRPRLMDFGIAKREDVNMTQTGTFLGTPSYASPEQIKEGLATARSDVFSFGVMVFELLSGVLPFQGNSINTILYRIVNEPPVVLDPPVVGILPEVWRRVFDKVLSKSPGERHPSCMAFMRELMDATQELDTDTRLEFLTTLRQGGLPLRAPAEEPHDATQSVPLTAGLGRLTEGVEPVVAVRQLENEAVSRPKKRGALGGLLAGVGLLGLAGAAYFFFYQNGAKSVVFEVEPPAKILKGGLEVGQSGSPLALKKGETVTLRAPGFKSKDVTFDGQGRAPRIQLEPSITLETLRSLPEGAKVVMDGIALEGVTPLAIQGWDQSRAHDVTFTHAGESKTLAVQFGVGDTPGTSVYALVDVPEAMKSGVVEKVDVNAPGSIRILGDYPVELTLDGRVVRPEALAKLPPGRHQLELQSPKFFYRERRSVQVQPGQSATIQLPGLCNLTVFHPAGDVVLINGISTGVESDGSTPIRVVKGRHQVSIQGRSASQTLELSGDQSIKFRL